MKLQKDDRVYIKTATGKIAMNELQPGDWVGARWGGRWVVLQNSAVLAKIVMLHDGDYIGGLYDHIFIASEAYTLLGRGKKRWWYDRLPRWLRTHFMPYSKPE